MKEYPDELMIKPFRTPCAGEVRVPGSKSLSNRALLLAALTNQKVSLQGMLFSRDTRLMSQALSDLGFQVEQDEAKERITLTGQGGRIPRSRAKIFVGNAGTAARFLPALVALHPDGEFEFDGDIEMRKRPIKDLLVALEALGARVHYLGEVGCFPFLLKTQGLRGGKLQVNAAASSQILSALLMVLPFASEPSTLSASGVRPAFVQMTLEAMNQFGISVRSGEGSFEIPKGSYHLGSPTYLIEPDATAASYFMMLPRLVGGELFIHGIREKMLQGDVAFVEVLKELGLNNHYSNSGIGISFQTTIQPKALSFNFNTFSDTFLTLAAASAGLQMHVRIEGIGHTRHQETDRVSGMANELKALGLLVKEEETSLEIDSRQGIKEGLFPINTYKDHRFAMSFGVLGSKSLREDLKPWVVIKDPGCCQKTFPGFFDQLESVRIQSEQNHGF